MKTSILVIICICLLSCTSNNSDYSQSNADKYWEESELQRFISQYNHKILYASPDSIENSINLEKVKAMTLSGNMLDSLICEQEKYYSEAKIRRFYVYSICDSIIVKGNHFKYYGVVVGETFIYRKKSKVITSGTISNLAPTLKNPSGIFITEYHLDEFISNE